MRGAKIRFILNPVSGHNRGRPWLKGFLLDFLQSRRILADLVLTESPGHATALARDAVREGVERVVAVGGDGTMNEIAQSLIHTSVTLGLIPCGSGNGLALHLGLQKDLRKALVFVCDPLSRSKAIDTGWADGRPFFNAMGMGLDAEISRRFNTLQKRGIVGYARTAGKMLLEIRPEKIRFGGDAWEDESEVLLVAVANSNQYGNHAQIAPGAMVDDGELDLVAVRPVGPLGAAALAVRLFAGSLHRSGRVRRERGRRFWIERSAPGLIHTDGETHQAGKLIKVTVQAGSLRVLVPSEKKHSSRP